MSALSLVGVLVLLATPGDIDSLLRQPALPDAELVLRAIEVRQRLRAIDGAPDADLEQRLRELEVSLAGAPVELMNAPRLKHLLRARMMQAEVQVLTLSKDLGPRHPELRKAQALATEYRRLFELLKVSTALEQLRESPAQLLVRREELEARERVQARLYLDKHPRLLATRAALVSVTRQLGEGVSRTDCELAGHAFDRRIESLRASTRAVADSHEALEEDAALDALLISRARLSVDEPRCTPLPEGQPIILAPVVELAGDAYLRARLSNGAVLQLNRSCGEFGGAGEGVLTLRSGKVVRFGEGRAAELPGQVLIESNVEAVNAPPGSVVSSRGTDAALAFRVLVIELAAGKVHEAPWDTFAPATAGKKRFIGLIRARGPRSPITDQIWDVLVWELATNKTRKVGSGKGPFTWRVAGDEVIAPTDQPIAINGSTGTVRPVANVEGSRPGDGLTWVEARSNLGSESPREWRSCDGRPVRIRYATETLKPDVAQGCPTLGPYWESGLLFTDRGVFRWPADLQLCR
ncbi:MAG: hypothetical protein Q8N23_03470 [Archangium sp.]|nr:hypothetical protein [Archangium sp.]MDP3573222.1 hypothetical protein [Archangium sp.]